MKLHRRSRCASLLAAAVIVAAFTRAHEAKSDTQPYGGVAAVYGVGQANSTEFLSTPGAIVSMVASGAGPSAIWQTLEHGEAVECLDCIGAVAPMLMDPNAKNREIAAWWLRKRPFGVFGPGEVYAQTVTTLTSDPSAAHRAYAANAIGEFLVASGVPLEATALTTDADPGVRAAAAAALSRLNDDGSGALTTALNDADETVQVAALEAAGRISTLADPAFPTTLVGLVGSPSALVRAHAVQLLDELDQRSAVASVLALAKGDANEDVRINACHALGTFGDTSAQASLTSIAQNDASTRVRDMATIALLRL
jgi:hypothetical protein